MSSPTLDPLDPAPVTPFSAHSSRDRRGCRIRTPYGIALIGVIAGLALLETTLPANAAPPGFLRKGVNRRIPAPPPASRSFAPRNPVRAGRVYPNSGYPNSGNLNNRNFNNGNFYNGTPNGTRRDYNGGSGSPGDTNGGADPGMGNISPEMGGTALGNGPLRSGVIPEGGKASPTPAPPVTGTGSGVSHLEAALSDLLAAQQMMEASATPDVVRIKLYLVTASHEIGIAQVKFVGQRHKAMVDIQTATIRLGQMPLSPQVNALTEDAINNVMACL